MYQVFALTAKWPIGRLRFLLPCVEEPGPAPAFFGIREEVREERNKPADYSRASEKA